MRRNIHYKPSKGASIFGGIIGCAMGIFGLFAIPDMGAMIGFKAIWCLMAFGMGIHGEPGVWNGPIKTADELAEESVGEILKDMPLAEGDEVALLINGLGATSLEELYILNNAVRKQLEAKGVRVYRSWTGEYATSMEMMGASISICKVDDELKGYFDYPVDTPFICQR